MFLRNERGLGRAGSPGGDGRDGNGVAVKNGTLGTVLEVAAGGERLTVRLDRAAGPGSAGSPAGQEEGRDGRVVTFSVRDYAHVDHGYAATIHKAQGVTVDRAHVLATPHMDRHAAYVGLTRHRDGVALHYAREDFGEPERLARTLGRVRAKDTSIDYPEGGVPELEPEDELVRRYAARRGLAPESEIVLRPQPEREAPAPQPAAKRGRFSGLKLTAGRDAPAAPEGARAEPQAEFTPPVRPLTEREREQARAEGLVADYARAWTDADRMRRASLPVLPHQEQALEAAGRALDLSGSMAGRDVRAALEAEPGLAWRIDSREGRQALIAAAVETRQDREALEARVRKAVRGWEALEQAHDRAAGQYEWEAARAVTQRMGAYAEALKRDPQLEDVLRTRGAEFGVEKGSRLERVLEAPEVTERLLRQVGLEQSRGLGRGPSLGR
jgi:hypothetical protein